MIAAAQRAVANRIVPKRSPIRCNVNFAVPVGEGVVLLKLGVGLAQIFVGTVGRL